MCLFLQVNFSSFGSLMACPYLEHSTIDSRNIEIEVASISSDRVVS